MYMALMSVTTGVNIRVGTRAKIFSMTVSLPRVFRWRNNSVYQA